ncbi:hypothetical protein [Burkholderia vietnamiensis]|uniref:hypothetical protein n=1 Tax=Burkholderia vietnamiensis TaxID=60552 RepID=UPI001593C73D|nr:hypothetical protein [Burkholderia vietnamiensis]HDR8971471.1 hypothetical protein [Burkholderia vietnamiensis]HDR9218583.1 hypothetical protein [Burkholderia vietnamiensis]
MDDMPDKLRRNVVVLSAAILAIAFFHLSFKPTGTLLGFAEVGNVSPFKIWVALTATLIYMFLRYRYATETVDEISAVSELFVVIRAQVVEEYIGAAVTGHLKRLRPITIFKDLEDFMDDTLEERMKQFGRASKVDVQVALEKPDSWWSGRASVDLYAEWISRASYGRSGGRMPEYRLNWRQRVRVIASSLIRAAGASRAGVDVAVPFGLSAVAMLVCLFKLAFYIST